jgi:hypothetical protein
MRVSRLSPLIAGVSLVVTGCAPSVQATRFSQLPPRPTDQEVLLYSTKIPECPYDEIGLVSGKPRTPWTSGDRVLAAVRARALELGGDAIVGLGQVRRVTGGTAVGESVSLDTTTDLTGTIVRFTDPDCRR